MPSLRVDRLETGLIGPLSFEVAEGECVALMGASGAGKSLLLRAIVDLDPSKGTVTFGGLDRCSVAASDWRKLVALVPAESGWWSDRVGDHFPSHAGVAELARRHSHLRGRWTGRSHVFPPASASGSLSHVPCAEIPRPSCSMSRRHHSTRPRRSGSRDLVTRCCQSGLAVLMVTHDRRQGERMARRILQMADGHFQEAAGAVA